MHREPKNLRIQPLQDPQRSIHFGECTSTFLKIVLRLKVFPENTDSQSENCRNASIKIQNLAEKELSQAYMLLNYLQKVHLWIRKWVGFELSQVVVKIIDELIKIRTDLKLVQWKYSSLTVSKKEEHAGSSGGHYQVPESQEEKIISYAALKAKENHFVSREKALVRKLFARTNRLPEWNMKSLVTFRNHPTFSNLLRGLKLLPESKPDLEDDLYLVGRYLSKAYTVGAKPKLTPSLRERAVLLKLEEVVENKMDHYFLSHVRCLDNWLKQLAEGRSLKSSILDETASKIS